MTRDEAKQYLCVNRQRLYDSIKNIKEDIEVLDMAIKALEQEPCENVISRQQAVDKMQELEDEDIEAYGCAIPEGFDGKRAIEALKALPSIQPIRPKGHWIPAPYTITWGSDAKCSNCGTIVAGALYDYVTCPYCSADMR